MRRTLLGLGFLAATAAPAAFAATNGTEDLYGVKWHATLDHAVAAAHPAEGSTKPVVLFRVLGDLDGLT
jgi:hypothetical protein